MNEFIRIFNKKNILLFLLLLMVSTGIFVFSANPDKEITLTGEALDNYIGSYQEFLKKTIEQGKSHTAIKLFNHGFAAEITEKSVSRYEKLLEIKPVSGDNRGTVLLLGSHVPELLALFYIIYIVSVFFDERKTGLSCMVRTAPKGREQLFGVRLLILLFASFASVFLLTAGNLIGTALTFGTGDLLRPIQSLPEFQKCPYAVSIGGGFLIITFIKAAGVFVVGMIMFVIRGAVNNLIFFVTMSGLSIAEIICALFIPPVSSLNLFKYINLFTFIKADDFFKGCIYLNIFDRAADAVKVAVLFTVIIITVFGAAGLYVYGKMYVKRSGISGRISAFIDRLRKKFVFQHTLLGWESYKLFIKQGAVVFFIVCIAFHIQQSSKYVYYNLADVDEQLYYKRYSDAIDREQLERAEDYMQMLKDSYVRYEKRLKELEADLPVTQKYYSEYQTLMNMNLQTQKSFEPILSDVRSAYDYYLKTGNKISLVEPYMYDALLNRDVQTRQRAAFLSVVAIVGVLAGIYCFEKHTNMKLMIDSTYRGRKVVRFYKPLLIILTSFLIPVILSVVQILNISQKVSFPGLSEPVQGIRYLREFGLNISVRAFLILMVSVRGLFGVVIGILTSVLSYFGDDKFMTACKTAIVIIVWILISEIIPGADIINPLGLLGFTF